MVKKKKKLIIIYNFFFFFMSGCSQEHPDLNVASPLNYRLFMNLDQQSLKDCLCDMA